MDMVIIRNYFLPYYINKFFTVGIIYLKEERIEYKGNWLDDKKHGEGILINKKTNYSYSGNWINDEPESPYIIYYFFF